MAAFLIGRGADVEAADDKGVSACLVAAATGASSTSLSMALCCFTGNWIASTQNLFWHAAQALSSCWRSSYAEGQMSTRPRPGE